MTVRRSLVVAAALLTVASGNNSAQNDEPVGLARASSYQWRALPDLPRAISGQMVGTSRGALVVAGGTNFPTPLFDGGTKVWYGDVYVLDEDGSRWRTEAPLSRPLAYAGVASIDDRIVIAGGSDASRHYADAFSLEWTGGEIRRSPLPPLPAPTANAGAAIVDRTFYLVGGSRAPDSIEALSDVWALDLQSPDGGWRRLPPVPGGQRILPVVVAQAGRVVVASGASLSAGPDGRPARRYLTDAYAWTPAASTSTRAGPSPAHAGSWRRLADVPRAVVAAPATTLGAVGVVVFGGDDGSLAERTAELRDAHPGFSRDVLAYDTTTDTWTSLGTLPTAPVTTNAVRLGDAVVIAGGELRPGFRTAAVSIGRADADVGGGRRVAPVRLPADAAQAPSTEPDALEQIDVYTAGEGGYHTYRIPSVIATAHGPAAAARVRMTVRTGPDDGRTWSQGRLVHAGPSAYSSVVALPDGIVGLLYERGDTTAYERLTFARMRSSWLADRQ